MHRRRRMSCAVLMVALHVVIVLMGVVLITMVRRYHRKEIEYWERMRLRR